MIIGANTESSLVSKNTNEFNHLDKLTETEEKPESFWGKLLS